MSPLGSTFESFPELNIGAVISVGAEGSGSIINVTVQLIDRDNGNVPVVANKAAMLTTENDGDVDINITHAAGAKTVYLACVMPDGQLYVSGAITFSAAIS